MELSSSSIDQIVMLMAIHLSAAISPGPSVVLVAHTSAFVSRKAGFVAASAMGLGAFCWATAALFGLHNFVTSNPKTFTTFKVLGAGFLIWTGAKMIRKADASASSSSERFSDGVFFNALKLQLTNPKVVVFFGAIFLAVFPTEIPILVKALALLAILINETLWYSLLAYALSFPTMQRQFQRFQRPVSIVCGIAICLLGAKLMSENLWD